MVSSFTPSLSRGASWLRTLEAFVKFCVKLKLRVKRRNGHGCIGLVTEVNSLFIHEMYLKRESFTPLRCVLCLKLCHNSPKCVFWHRAHAVRNSADARILFYIFVI